MSRLIYLTARMDSSQALALTQAHNLLNTERGVVDLVKPTS